MAMISEKSWNLATFATLAVSSWAHSVSIRVHSLFFALSGSSDKLFETSSNCKEAFDRMMSTRVIRSTRDQVQRLKTSALF